MKIFSRRKRTLLEVLDVLGGEGDADAVNTRLLLAVALDLSVTRHDGRKGETG